ncbi:MAG: hypothetical protein EPN41_09135 [Candidimonas sp.]|nr:MAG: hypothetical protein EPN41_09135 [Candidimonas sp.]
MSAIRPDLSGVTTILPPVPSNAAGLRALTGAQDFMTRALHLIPTQRIALALSVGYPGSGWV